MTARLLVPLDGSEHASKALGFASDIARMRGAGVLLLHVLVRHADPGELHRLARLDTLSKADRRALEQRANLRSPAMADAGGYVPASVPDEVLRRVAEQILKAAERSVAATGLAEVTTLIEDGDPARCILAVAAREQVDAIVMGSRGLGYLEGMFMGSVSHKVTQRAPCTCLVVT